MEKQFNYKNLPVRTITDVKEEVWFAGIDVCQILGYAKPDASIKKLDEDERKLTLVKQGSGQSRKTWTINEFGLYSLILNSRKPEAKVFKRWVTHDVLPAIRKAGKYTTENAQLKEAEIQLLIADIEKSKADITDSQTVLKDLKTKLSKKQDELIIILKTDPNQLKIEFTEN